MGVCLFTGPCTRPRRTSPVTVGSLALVLAAKLHCVEPHVSVIAKHPHSLSPRYSIVVQYASSGIPNRQSKAHSHTERLPHYTNPRSSPLLQVRASCLSRFLGRYARIRNFTPQSPPRRIYPLCDRICSHSNGFATKRQGAENIRASVLGGRGRR